MLRLRNIHLLAIVLIAIGCGQEPHSGPVTAASTGSPLLYPHYNEVFQKATHNSYWVNNKTPGDWPWWDTDPMASGTQERIEDQLLYEHARSLELDIHNDGPNPGEFTVYHTSEGTWNSLCYRLTDCLQIIKRFEYLVPAHEVLTILLEFKEIDNPLFDARHTFRDLDRQLWEYLGPHLYTPREFMQGCPGAPTLTDCIKQRDWPTTDELRGRVIVAGLGNWGHNYFDWINYANSGIQQRAIFPMRTMLNTSAWGLNVSSGDQAAMASVDYHPEIEFNVDSYKWLGIPRITDKLHDNSYEQNLKTARLNSIFWQVENPAFKTGHLGHGGGEAPNDLGEFLGIHGVARSTDAHDPDHPDKWLQGDATDFYGTQLILTDFPWHFGFDDQARSLDPLRAPTQANRGFFDACEMKAGSMVPVPACKFAREALIEPGARLLTGSGWTDASVTSPLIGVDYWESEPSGTGPTHDNKLPPFGMPGSFGCLFASTPTGENRFSICRQSELDKVRTVHVFGGATFWGKTTNFDYQLPGQHSEQTDIGELLRLAVYRNAFGTTVYIATAATVGPSGQPVWNAPPQNSFSFPGVFLTVSGISSVGETLFTRTLHNGQLMFKGDFARISNNLFEDQSACGDGRCVSAPQPAHEHQVVGVDGRSYVGVHEATGTVFNQPRHLYTTDGYELETGGLIDWRWADKFYLHAGAPDFAEATVYRCVDWRSNYHTHWLSTNASCPNNRGPQGLNAGAIGNIATQAGGARVPVWHVRKGTFNSGSENTHDHVYVISLQELNQYVAWGYEIVEVLGYAKIDPNK
jgi:hypothetical protein